MTVKMSRVRSNQCVVGVLEPFLSFIFFAVDFNSYWTLSCRVLLLSYFHKRFMLSYSSVILVGLVVLLQVARSMDVLGLPIPSFSSSCSSLLLRVLLLPSLILFLLLLRLTVIVMDVLSFPIQYSLLSSGSYTDLSSMVLSFSAHHINSRTLLLLV